MPIYEYTCSKCGKTNEVLQKVDDPAPEQCERCGTKGSLKKVVSRSSFVLRGGGWYADLYGTVKKDGAKDSKESKPAEPAKSTSDKSEKPKPSAEPGSPNSKETAKTS